MSADKHHSDELQRYLAGQMSDKERHAFERRALDDPFLQDAMEGAETMDANDFVLDVKQLNERIVTKKSGFRWYSIAAVIALFIISGMAIWLIQDTQEVGQLAQKNTTEKEDSTAGETEQKDTVMVEDKKQVAEASGTQPAEGEEASFSMARQDTQDAEILMDVESTATGEAAQAEPLRAEQVVADDLAESERDAWKEDAAEAKTSATAPVRQKAKAQTESAKKEPATTRSATVPSRKVTGLVMDDFGEPLPGVNVVIKGTTTGVTTDLDGQFALEVNDEQSLVFSSVGMQSQETAVGARSTIEVYLTPDTKELQEVVVTGYGAYENEPEGFIEAQPTMGHTDFKKYLEEELAYPQRAESQGIEGRVVLQLTISPTGNVTSVEVKRSLGFGCDEEAIRLIKQGPRWSPATRDGVNVESKVRVRVKFELK